MLANTGIDVAVSILFAFEASLACSLSPHLQTAGRSPHTPVPHSFQIVYSMQFERPRHCKVWTGNMRKSLA